MHARSKKITKAPTPPGKAAGNQSPLALMPALALALAAATLAVYWGALSHDFTIWDDDIYVTANPYVQTGLNARSITWALNIGYAANWHPLTWISHMADVQFYGQKPMGHHLTSVLLHIANVLLIFWILTRMTGAVWKSAFVAALFALHPLHVESVAWVSERKDVLSTFFGLLTILAYVRYADRPEPRRYLPVVAVFSLSLMSKPMLVTLPVVLLLLDYWPLRRMQGIGPLLREKAPLFALSLASGIITIIAQRSAGAVASTLDCPLTVRLGNAVLSYVKYLMQMIWPRDLVIDYPYTQSLPVWQVASAAAFLVAVTALVIVYRARQRYLLVGWLWYVVTLVPVIGLLQVGDQSKADRYTYVPLIGVFVMVSWGMSEAVARSRAASRIAPVLGLAALVALGVSAGRQAEYWRDSIALFEHTLSITPDNPVIQNDLGSALASSNRLGEAVEHCREALRLNPDYAKAHYNLAYCLRRQGDIEGAIAHYTAAIQADPRHAKAHNDLAVVCLELGRFDEAIDHCIEAIAIRPDYAAAHGTLSMAYFNTADYAKAWEEAQLCEKHGHTLPPAFIEDLASKLRSTR
jgi:tetratricopeptide (TPR) repeat protein